MARSGWTTRGRARSSLRTKVERSGQGARKRADAHLERHEEDWFYKRYEELATAFGVTREPAMDWHSRDLQTIAAECASRSIDSKQALRLARIDSACRSISATGKLRANRRPAQDAETARDRCPAQDSRGRPDEAPPPWEDVPPRQSLREHVLNTVDRAKDIVRARGRGDDSRLPVSVRAQREATARAEAHHAKHRDAWFDKRHRDMLSMLGVTNGAAPGWAVPHLKDIAREIAERQVEGSRTSRLFRIDKASYSMRATGRVRETRKSGRDNGLGE